MIKITIKTALGEYKTLSGPDLRIQDIHSGILITAPRAPRAGEGASYEAPREIIAGAFLPAFFEIETE